MGSINTLIIIGSAIGGVFICIIVITCCCLYYFWKKNKRLIRQQKKEQQPLNKNGTHDLNRNAHHTQQNTSSNMHNLDNPNPSNNNHALHDNDDGNGPTQYSQEDTTNSSDFVNANGIPKWDDSKFDANFLVHPENYAPGSQASESGNNSNVNHMHINHALNGASVTTSSGNPPPSPITRSLHINKYHQEQHRKLISQKHRLHAIVRNARNKLQLIDSHHISFEYEVGRGKFGKVFRAMWTDSNTKQQKTVAVKWFKQDEVDQEVFEDFLKEISVAAHLPPHDNVLQIYGFCISPYALVTEYVNGGSVEISVSVTHEKSIRAGMTMGDCVQMLIDTAAGISHLHTVNIIHRDVAARNLLIDNISDRQINDVIYEESRCSRRVIVCDFGLSRITQNPDEKNFTNSHVGPLKWMSPESIKQQIYNSSTDVYSFGVVMWEILCGMPPYPCTKVLSLAVEVISKQTRPFVLEWFPRPLKILMQRCWQEIAEFRPSFEDIKNELSLFKQELIDKKKENEALISICSLDLNKLNKTKEKLRSLSDLYDNYLNEDKYHWDRLIKPKLKQLIDKYNKKKNENQHKENERNREYNENILSLHNNISESTYYDDQIAVMQQMNVSNKRISSDHDEENENEHKNKNENDKNVSRRQILPLLTSASLSMDADQSNHLQLQPNNNNNNETKRIHNLGDSVQIDL